MLNPIIRIWNFITRIARVLVKVDDAFIEAKAFWDWLIGDDEDESEV